MENVISVIIPVYNAEKYIEKCLNSVLNQTYANLDIVLINDGSTDGSGAIIEKYSRADARVRCIDVKNAGVSNARNVGLERCVGDYVLFLDSDDWIDERTCELALEALQNRNADVVMWPYIREYANSSYKKDIFPADRVLEGEQLEKLKKAFAGYVENGLLKPDNMDALAPVWGKLYKRSVIRDSVFVDIRRIGSFEDGLFNLAVFQNVTKAVYLNQYFSHYRRDNVNSVTSSNRGDIVSQRYEIYRLIREFLEEHHLDDGYQKALSNRVVYDIIYIGLAEVDKRVSFRTHVGNLRSVMERPEYEKARKQFPYQCFPLHWKIFYFFAVHRAAAALYCMLWIMQSIRRHRH